MNPERLRIVLLSRAVAPWHGVGGLERHVADMTRHLVRRGVRVTLVTPPPARHVEAEELRGAARAWTMPLRTGDSRRGSCRTSRFRSPGAAGRRFSIA